MATLKKDNRPRKERLRDAALEMRLRFAGPNYEIENTQVQPGAGSSAKAERLDWNPDEVLQHIEQKLDREYARQVQATAQHLHDVGGISSVSGKRTLGMSKDGDFRYCGSLPFDLWRADEMLYPDLPVKERVAKLLRQFPQYAVGKGKAHG
jgi:hypothetical protein